MTTYITNFDRLVLGRNAPAVLEAERDNIDETISVFFHNFSSYTKNGNVELEQTRAELREKENEYALFLFQYPDSEVPDWWKDSELIWSTEEENKKKEREENWKKLFELIDSEDVTSDEIEKALTNLARKK
jgi:hypothetical protein